MKETVTKPKSEVDLIAEQLEYEEELARQEQAKCDAVVIEDKDVPDDAEEPMPTPKPAEPTPKPAEPAEPTE